MLENFSDRHYVDINVPPSDTLPTNDTDTTLNYTVKGQKETPTQSPTPELKNNRELQNRGTVPITTSKPNTDTSETSTASEPTTVVDTPVSESTTSEPTTVPTPTSTPISVDTILKMNDRKWNNFTQNLSDADVLGVVKALNEDVDNCYEQLEGLDKTKDKKKIDALLSRASNAISLMLALTNPLEEEEPEGNGKNLYKEYLKKGPDIMDTLSTEDQAQLLDYLDYQLKKSKWIQAATSTVKGASGKEGAKLQKILDHHLYQSIKSRRLVPYADLLKMSDEELEGYFADKDLYEKALIAYQSVKSKSGYSDKYRESAVLKQKLEEAATSYESDLKPGELPPENGRSLVSKVSNTIGAYPGQKEDLDLIYDGNFDELIRKGEINQEVKDEYESLVKEKQTDYLMNAGKNFDKEERLQELKDVILKAKRGDKTMDENGIDENITENAGVSTFPKTYDDLVKTVGPDRSALIEWLKSNPTYQIGEVTKTKLGLTPEELQEIEEARNPNTTPTPTPTPNTISDNDWDKQYDRISKQYNAPKNGAEYLKSLWNQGGKAAAVGNVLGNLMGAVGKGLRGEDYKTDWQQYKENYIQQQNERNRREFEDNMDIIKQLRMNDVARDELIKQIDNYAKIGGNIDAEKFTKIKKALVSSGNGSMSDYAITSLLETMASNPDFKELVQNILSGLSTGISSANKAINAIGGKR